MSVRVWRPGYALDLGSVLRPLQRGAGDPTYRRTPGGAVFRATNTPCGPGTLAVRRVGDEVHAEAWGDGAEWLLAGLPALLGDEDDDAAFQAHHDIVAEARRRMPGLRLGSTRRVWDLVVPSILEQKVTGKEAFRSFRELCLRFGVVAPGPLPLRVPPTPKALLAITDWEWHKAGVDGARRRALIAAAQVAGRLEKAAELKGVEGRTLLRKVPGVGVWTAAEVAQRAWGDPDAVSFGDYHVPGNVGYALVGKPLDDAGMQEVLAPYAPQRQRAVRYIEAAGITKPRRGPRFSPRDYRAM